MNMEFKRKMPSPQEVKDMYSVTEEMTARKKQNDKEIRDVFTGKDNRLVLVIGPCSADREDAVLDYISRLREVQEKVKDKILIIPRIYTNKPRTTGDGYKGMLHQPDPNGSPDMLKGLIAIRKLHLKALEQTGFSCADEMLYPRITTSSPTCFHMLQSAQGRSRISSTASPQAALTCPSA